LNPNRNGVASIVPDATPFQKELIFMATPITDPTVRALQNALQQCQTLLSRAVYLKNAGEIETYGAQLDHLQQKLDNYLAGNYPTLLPRKEENP